MFCKKCGKGIEEDFELCVECTPKKKQSKLRLVVLILVTPVIFIIIFTLLTFRPIGYASEPSRRISCCSNLKQVGLSLAQYADDFEMSFPEKDDIEGLEQLRANDFMTDYGVYTCPTTTTSSGESGPLTRDNCDYIYMGGFKKLVGPKDKIRDVPLVFDIPGSHKDYINVCFLNGLAQGIKTDKVKNCKGLVVFLNDRYKYDPVILKKLMEKAENLDKIYGLK